MEKKKNINYIKNFEYKIFLFNPIREKIYRKVNDRFKTMMNTGAIDEVQKLLKLNLDKSLPIMRAHGVPEISDFINKKCSFDECISAGQQVTRHYVKRQLTWWRSTSLPIDQVFDEFPNDIDEKLIKI